MNCPRCNAEVSSQGQLIPTSPSSSRANSSSIHNRFVKCPQCHHEILLARTTPQIAAMEQKLKRMKSRQKRLREQGREIVSLARAILILENRLTQAKLESGLH